MSWLERTQIRDYMPCDMPIYIPIEFPQHVENMVGLLTGLAF